MAQNPPDRPEDRTGKGVTIRKSRKGRVIASGLPNRNGKSFVNPSGKIGRKNNGRTGRKIFAVTGIIIISVLLVAITAVSIFWSYIFSGFRPDKSGEITLYPSEALTHEPPFKDKITNILLIEIGRAHV